MNDEQRFNDFILAIKEAHKVWLLQASDGLFAMLEDEQGKTFLPVWSSEQACREAAIDDWSGYDAAAMSLTEILVWCDELQTDEILLGVEPLPDGNILPLTPEVFKNIFARI